MKKILLLISILLILLLATSCDVLPIDKFLNKETDNPQAVDQETPAPELEVEVFEYVINGNAASILKYNGNDSYVEIPESINGVPVTRIKSGAFIRSTDTDADREKKTFYIPYSITIIETNAFSDDGNIYVTPHAKKPSGWADSSFKGDAKNQGGKGGNIYYESYNTDLLDIDGILYLYDRNQAGYRIISCRSKDTNIKLPATINNIPVNHIGQGAFQGNTELKKITISENIIYIWHDAFRYCTSLKDVEFACPSLAKILGRAFLGCTSLKRIELPQNVFFLQDEAFANCGTIKELYIPAGMISVGTDVFCGTQAEKVYYQSSKNDFYRISNYQAFEDMSLSDIVFGEKTIIEGISTIPNVKELPVGVGITVRGYVTTYVDRGETLLIVDENNQNGIYVSILSNDGVEYPKPGDFIEVTGSTSSYDGQFCISNIDSITHLGEMIIEPIEVSIDELNKNFVDYLFRYIKIQGTVEHIEGYYTYISDLDLIAFTRSSGNPMKQGSEVSICGTVSNFGLMYEFEYSYQNVEIFNRVSILETTITEAKKLPTSTEVKITGYVAAYINYKVILLINEDNTDGIIVYIQLTDAISTMPECGDQIEITGLTALYKGQYEITNIESLSIIGSKEITPLRLSVEDFQSMPSKYAYIYIEFIGKISKIDDTLTYYEGISLPHYHDVYVNPFNVGDEIIFRGTVLPYNSTYELRANFEILEKSS